MKPGALAAFAALSLFSGALAQDDSHIFYYITYATPQDEQILSFAGKMQAPTLPHKGWYYLWPGLQDGTGVLQPVLSGGSGSWTIGSGWCCNNPSIPWGPEIPINNGEEITFNMTKGSSNWTSWISGESSSNNNLESYALNYKQFDQAVFAIELYSQHWDFGQLSFSDVTIVSTGTDSSWCTGTPDNGVNNDQSASYTSTGGQPSVNGNTVTCYIENLTLQHPNTPSG